MLQLTGCRLHASSTRLVSQIDPTGVEMLVDSSAQLSRVSMPGSSYRISGDTRAAVSVSGSTLSDALHACVIFGGASSARLDHCTLTVSKRCDELLGVQVGTAVRAST